MKQQLSSLLIALASSAALAAHGGQYRGPGEIVPPGSSSGSSSANKGATTNGGNLSGSAATAAPPGPSAPSVGATGGFTARGSLVGDDLTRWSFWWEFNKDRFINLRAALDDGGPKVEVDPLAVHLGTIDPVIVAQRPSRRQILDEVLPPLRQALLSTTNRDVITACLVGIAKIAAEDAGTTLPLLARHLNSADQEVRETAALALGITQLPAAMPMLLDLLGDTSTGREVTGRSEVDVRTRTFAAYAVGLVANRPISVALRNMAFEALRSALTTTTDRNLQIGAIQGIRMIRVGAAAEAAERALRDAMVAALWTTFTAESELSAQQVQAHVPGAIATLLGRGGDPAGTYKSRLLAELRETRGQRSIFLVQSAALALGQLCTADARDAEFVSALAHYASEGRDQQSRYFALMALGEIGGESCRAALLQRLEKGKDQERSWAALALGVFAHETLQRAGRTGTRDRQICAALLDSLRSEHNPEVLTALAVSLGLSRHADAADTLRQLLDKYRRDDERAGYLAIGLALVGDRESLGRLRELLEHSTRRPDLIRQVAVAMGKLGGATAADDLARMLQQPDRNVAKLSAIASALGLIGNRNSISPLVSLLFDDQVPELSRAFAAAALGSIGDKDDLPWNAKIGSDANYRAAVETLTNQCSGILDIL